MRYYSYQLGDTGQGVVMDRETGYEYICATVAQADDLARKLNTLGE